MFNSALQECVNVVLICASVLCDHVLNALTRCVFRSSLKTARDGQFRMLAGSRFHSVGSAK